MKEQRMARSLVGKGSLATKLVLTLVAACMAISLGWLVGCSSGEKQQEGSGQSTEDISVYSREDGSGTRGAFIELFGLEEADDQGNKVDTTTDAAAITNSTSVMMTSVKGDPGAIGYISLGSLDDSVKSLKIDDVEATADNVKDGRTRSHVRSISLPPMSSRLLRKISSPSSCRRKVRRSLRITAILP